MPQVPNQFPSLNSTHRIAIVGEAPGKDEESLGKPFIGASGRLLDQLLSKAGIIRSSCFVGNITQRRPPGNVIAEFDWDGPEIQSGLEALSADLKRFDPHLIIPLGNTALHAFKEGNVPLKKRKDKEGLKFVYPNSIDNWRGSRFLSVETTLMEGSPLPNVKCLPSYHPAMCLRAYENVPLLTMDLVRAAKEAKTRELILPQRNLITNYSYAQLIDFIADIRTNRRPVSLDIEGSYQYLPCISIAPSGLHSVIIPFALKGGTAIWSEDREVTLWMALAGLLADPNVPKCWQNGLYDRFSLHYGFGMSVFGNQDDTMLKWWEKYCELPKALGVQASILTDEPYYKGDIKSQDDSTFFRYCCRDSAVTQEINLKLERLLPLHHPAAVAHYRLNHSLLNLFLYIELRGMLYDKLQAKQKLEAIETYILGLQAALDALAGVASLPETVADRIQLLRDTCCYKRDPSKPKAEYSNQFSLLLQAAEKPILSEVDKGLLSTALGLSLNIKSPAFKAYLYGPKEKGGLGLPVQYSKTSGAETTDYLALQRLSKKHLHRALDLAIEIGLLRTRSQMLAISSDSDGRIRSSYNVVGTKTGRITSSTSPTGSGYNLQTLPDDDKSKPSEHPLRYGMRRLVLADPGHWMFQCDLKGSDGWTIGAHLNSLGDSTMLDDLRHGIKPASRICYMLRHGIHSLKGKTRDEIKHLLLEVKGDDWDYFACKVGIWGLCYLMGPDLLADQIFEESEGKVTLSRKEVVDFKTAVFDGYRIKLWHDATTRRLASKPVLTSASGHTRRFYGRSTEILGEALAHEPQSNTTYATNMAAYRLWMDEENREEREVLGHKGRFIKVPFRVEPLHQVHDALIGQFLHEHTDWAIPKIRAWFDNPLIIANQRIVIPFDGKYGESWGNLSAGKI